MILGRGTAQTDDAICVEYQQFLTDYPPVRAEDLVEDYRGVPGVLRRKISKPMTQWQDDDILSVFVGRSRSTWQMYCAFLAFLIYRGYIRPSVALLGQLPCQLCRVHKRALAPHRQRFVEAAEKLGYSQPKMGPVLNLLIALLAVSGKPIEEITRDDLDQFRHDYEQWRANQGYKAITAPRITRLEYYLVYWGYIPRYQHPLTHEKHLAQLRNPTIRTAIEFYFTWCAVKYKVATIKSRRAPLLTFFLWLQEHYPAAVRLDDVTRPLVLEYAQHIKQRGLSAQYQGEMYRAPCLFYEFAIQEELPTSPPRNPFTIRDIARGTDRLPRYLEDHVIQTILTYCEEQASLLEQTLVILLLHTGIRGSELAALRETDIVQIQGRWKLHIHEGKGLKDRVIPLTEKAYTALRAWQEGGWERANSHLFTNHGHVWRRERISRIIREMTQRLGLEEVTPHRFRHTFAVALLNYGMRETALQKLLGHESLNMTLHYARILDRTVEQAFDQAVGRMQDEPLSWVPNFFVADDYTLFSEGDAVGWIRLPLGYCRRNPKLHCESDVKCLLCNRFRASPADLPRFYEMYERFVKLGLTIKAEVVLAQIRQLEAQQNGDFIPLEAAVPAIPTPVALATS